jgi:hypothetical protein
LRVSICQITDSAASHLFRFIKKFADESASASRLRLFIFQNYFVPLIFAVVIIQLIAEANQERKEKKRKK